MTPAPNATAECGICGRHLPVRRLADCAAVRPGLAAALEAEHPDWQRSGFVCLDELARARRRSIEQMLLRERGELTDLDRAVVNSLAQGGTVSHDVEADFVEDRSLGDRVADRVARFGGSWAFIIAFCAVLAVWMAFNLLAVTAEQFDPYPFILLNLVLSSVAALQAPIIMMSQRRQEEKDRARSENDYRINLKAELEIRHLHEKLDHLLMRQWERLTEIQQVQLELMEDIANAREQQ
ncbi:DUF1003 domain-containing protein [Zavarzinia compransoris]|uniref:DUF1003 domain-containing protein n=1 Tax=Zavarzinia compransoris TaxID=1264899 RepID=A0A317DYL1_9PROT|nr:DUF1003 domain-containing protein [Zavarzinia compransoris]PWR19837.1 hypothetical protein DKG75_15385 [Zavarzinia compransoris]TDP45054.1 putative membrane protein [Zavarzinia compransoris]